MVHGPAALRHLVDLSDDSPDFETQLATVTTNLHKIKQEIAEFVTKDHPHIVQALTHNHRIVNEFSSLCQQVQGMEFENLIREVNSTINEKQRLEKNMASAKQMLKLLDYLTETNNLLQRFDNAIQRDDLQVAAELISCIRVQIDSENTNTLLAEEANLSEIVRQRYEGSRERLKEVALSTWSKTIRRGSSNERKYETIDVKEDDIDVLTSPLGCASVPQSLLLALHVTDLLDDIMTELSNNLKDCIRLWGREKRTQPPMTIRAATELSCVIIEGLASALFDFFPKVALADDVDEHRDQVSGHRKALAQEVLVHFVGSHIWPTLSGCLRENILSPSLKLGVNTDTENYGSSDQHSSFRLDKKAAEQRLSELREKLKRVGFPTQDADPSELLREVEERFASEMCDEMLHQVRLLLQDDDVQAVDVEDTFSRNHHYHADGTCVKYTVSNRATKLLGILRNALEMASVCNVPAAFAICNRAKEVIKLYVAAAQRSSEILFLSLLMHNDAIYLATECLTLVLPYYSRLPAVVASETSFADLNPLLLNLAQSVLSQAISRASDTLLDTLAWGQGFVAIGEDKRAGDHARLAGREILRQLSILSAQWSKACPAGAVANSVTTVFSPMLERLVQIILELKHISDQDSLALGDLVGQITDECELLSTKLCELGQSAVPSIARCRLVVFTLRSRLQPVLEKIEQGSLGILRPSELLHLMKALWTEEALRSHAQTTIRSLEAATRSESQ